MTSHRSNTPRRDPVFVPVVLTDTEAFAVAAACAVVARSAPGSLASDHPLFSARQKIERAERETKAKATR